MSTIQPQRRTVANWLPPIGVMCGIAFRSALVLSLLTHPLPAQDGPEPSTTENVQRPVDEERSFDAVKVAANEMKVDLIEKFSKELEFGEKLMRVDGFDSSVISVTALSPNRLRIQGLEQNVTTLIITGESGQKYIIHVHVNGDARHLQAVLLRHFPNSAIKCVKLVNGAVLLTGYVADTQTITQILDVASLYAPAIINHMRVGGPQEVQLRVKILEVQRSKLRTFGMDLQGLGQNAVLASSPGGIAPLTSLINPIGGPPSITASPSPTNLPSLTAGFNTNHFAFNAFLQVLKEEGLLKFHTEPVLITRSGEPARLADGGEFPIPVPGGLGTVTIEFREFGVILETLPTVITPTRVKQQVNVSVSDKDTSNSITLLGTTVPGISKREIKSTVEMNFGDTMVIGGLINTRHQGTTLKTPFFGELPIVGAAFRKVVYQEAETELIIMITPEFGSSLPTDQIPPGGPGLFTSVPTDRELYGSGLIEVPRFGANCGPDGGSNFSRGDRSDCFPSGPTGPASGFSSPGPAISPMNNPNSALPSSGGLIGPPGTGPSEPIPPGPSASNNTTKQLSNRSFWPSKSRSSTSKKLKETDPLDDFEPIQPAGFKKSPKTQQ